MKKLPNLKKENEKLKNEISDLRMDNESLEENKNFYQNKYRDVCNILQKVYNSISDENNQVPNKCPDCGSEIFYDPIGHYGMCLKCGKNFNMFKFWDCLNNKQLKIPCTKYKFKIEYENNKKKEE